MRLEEIGKDWARFAEEIRFVRRVEAAARDNSGAKNHARGVRGRVERRKERGERCVGQVATKYYYGSDVRLPS